MLTRKVTQAYLEENYSHPDQGVWKLWLECGHTCRRKIRYDAELGAYIRRAPKRARCVQCADEMYLQLKTAPARPKKARRQKAAPIAEARQFTLDSQEA